ncbi:MAG: hypothetical protein H8E42_08295 [Nitrospinae bacterium]|nr:hypothetical protein [Nitrospinota bacterium]MBL7020628.1 hypothetical protein [Nitrospinaceae bacterium]
MKITEKTAKMFLVVFAILGFNYGVSFQQFLHFDWTDPRGLGDSVSYLAMSNGDADIASIHRYRIIIPFLADLVRDVIRPLISSEHLHAIDALSFYIVNYFITSLAGLFLYLFLVELKFKPERSLMGVFIFLGSRITILSTGAPVVDSLYYLAIIVIVYFCLTQRSMLLCLLAPLLILTKETTVPFLFLPLLLKTINRKLILLSLSVSFAILFWVRSLVTAALPNAVNSEDPILVTIGNHLSSGLENLSQSYFSLTGWHDLFSPFSVFWVIALFGAWLEYKKIDTYYEIPRFLLWIIPITLGFTVLSSNSGRMLHSLFPVVIPYALIGIDYVLSRKQVGS